MATFHYGDMVILTKGTKGIRPGTKAMFESYDGDGGAFVMTTDGQHAQVNVRQLRKAQ